MSVTHASDVAKLIDDKVFIRLDDPEKFTRGGLVLPDSVKSKVSQTATVLAVGPGRWLIHENGAIARAPMQVVPGDRILCGPYAGAAVEVDGKKGHRILPEDQILAVLGKELKVG